MMKWSVNVGGLDAYVGGLQNGINTTIIIEVK